MNRTSYSYTFTGNPASTVEEYKGIQKRTDYTYDHRCRLIAETTTIGSNSGNESATTYPPASITYSYDALGKLVSKRYGNGVTETVDYNIQGWQTGIAVKGSDDNNIYSQSLRFYDPAHGTAPLYTGNICEWSTTTASHQTNTYRFGYDKLGRLRNTDCYVGAASTPTVAFTERGITYDMNGNIKTLQRYAQNTASPADSYTYSYEGNALASISGTDNNASISGVQYSYDANGNMIHDGLKNLELSYNLLNLPSVVSQAGNEKATYIWFADGSKYSVLDNSNNGYYYIGSLIYASNSGNLQIESTAFAGGRINLVENTINNTLSQDIQYHHTDHLGSVRTITNQSGETVEQNAYYPFGSRHTFGNTYAQTTNRFKFNGKEEQTTGNLQYLDYGARMYDSKIARWFVQDPLSEKYYAHSPYNYCVNNPIMFVDPDGKDYNLHYNHRNKTITVEATYYTNKKGLGSLMRAVDFYNSRTTDKYNYNGEEYSVIYNLSYSDCITDYTFYTKTDEELASDYQNTYKIIPEIKNTTGVSGKISGNTLYHKVINITEDFKYNETTGAHEIGHTLYLVPTDQHSETGLMTQFNDASRTAELTQDNINNMIESAKLDFWERVKNFVYNFVKW